MKVLSKLALLSRFGISFAIFVFKPNSIFEGGQFRWVNERRPKMTKELDLDYKGDFFSARSLEEIAVVELKENLLFYATDLGAKEEMLSYLELVSRSEPIKVLVIFSSPRKTGCEEYFEFYRQASEGELDRNAITRMYYAVDQFILKIVEMDKIVVHADSGKVIPIFLNVSLACDYRIVANNTVFQNPCLQLGLVPKGGGAFFLSKMLGLSKASELMLSEREVTAEEALRLGLVNEVVPFEKLEEATLKIAREFAQKPSSTLLGVKRLLNYSIKDLADYLELENRVLLRIAGPLF